MSDLDGVVMRSCRLPEPPSPPGGYYEQNYSVRVQETDLFTLMSRLKACLDRNQVQVENVNWDKYKFRCSKIIEEETIPFVIRVFSSADELPYFLEFQKRSGCSLKFAELYQQLVASLSGKDTCTSCPNKFELDAQTCKSLYDMLNSNYLENKTQALRTIASHLQHIDPKYIPAILEVCTYILIMNKDSSEKNLLAKDLNRCAGMCVDQLRS